MELSLTLHRLRSRLSQSEDAAALVVFRMGFGLIMCFDMIRYGYHFRVADRYASTDFHFKYLGFGWVEAPTGDGLLWLLTGLAVLAAMIATGFLYRWATILFTVVYQYVLYPRRYRRRYDRNYLPRCAVLVPGEGLQALHRERSVR